MPVCSYDPSLPDKFTGGTLPQIRHLSVCAM